MKDKDNYTKEDILEELVEENRKFRKEIMIITKIIAISAAFIVFIIEVSNCIRSGIYFFSPSDFTVTSSSSNTNVNANTNTFSVCNNEKGDDNYGLQEESTETKKEKN